jgi:dGTPase
MILSRIEQEGAEIQWLAPYAVKSSESKGRMYAEKEDTHRTCFQRDRDRIIHSKAFRRLNGKTQVFIAGYGDHYRSRLTHSMEVAQFSRDIARTLKLNQDLAESIALAHDLGHTPFGHAGQEAMHELMKEHGGRFEHNEQSYRVLNHLEKKSDHYDGLNVSYEILDGLIKHRTDYDHPIARDHHQPSLEAQVVNLSDEIAYQNHDIDDGLRSGILLFDQMQDLSIWQAAQSRLDLSAVSEIARHQMVTEIMSLMVKDLTVSIDRTLSQNPPQSVHDIYRMERLPIHFSPEMTEMASELRAFLYKYFYQSPAVMTYNDQGKEVIRTLFYYYYDQPEKLPEHFHPLLESEDRHVVVKDYIAGMTDRFAMELYDRLVKS